MGVEIERKFLVRGEGWRTANGTLMAQGYLCRGRERTVRVRIAGDEAFLTIKGPGDGAARLEFEYAIPVEDARELMTLCERPLIEKTRHRHHDGGHTWEVDEFHGDNAGLVIAEIELDTENEPFTRPPWLGQEVTGDPRYYNANLVTRPYSTWPR